MFLDLLQKPILTQMLIRTPGKDRDCVIQQTKAIQMTVQNDIGVKMRDKLHLQIFFQCCRCGESICSTGIANDYHYPLWFIKDPIFPAEEGYVCSECANKKI